MSEEKLKKILKENLDEHTCPLQFEKVWEKAQEQPEGRKVIKMKKLRKILAFAATLILVVGVGTAATYEIRKDDMSYSFKNDEEVLGEWKTVAFVNEIEDFKVDEIVDRGLYLRGLEFQTGGTLKYTSQEQDEEGMVEWASPSSWSKGYINHYGNETRAEYEIREVDGKEYLFFQWKSGDYTYSVLDYVPYYVLERGEPTERDFEKELEGRIIDDVTYSFVDDPQVLGQWQVVDFVDSKEVFNPNEKKWDGEWLTGLTFYEQGGLEYIIKNKRRPANPDTWSRGYVVNRQSLTRSLYEVVEIEGKEYLFFEWKSGDYVYGMIDYIPYYVLERVE